MCSAMVCLARAGMCSLMEETMAPCWCTTWLDQGLDWSGLMNLGQEP